MTPLIALRVSDWTTTPGGRYRNITRWSGEEYRDKVLIPALEQAEVVEVNLDGVAGYGSGWLSEVFEALVGKIGPSVRPRIRLTSTEYSYRVDQVYGWMDEAVAREEKKESP